MDINAVVEEIWKSLENIDKIADKNGIPKEDIKIIKKGFKKVKKVIKGYKTSGSPMTPSENSSKNDIEGRVRELVSKELKEKLTLNKSEDEQIKDIVRQETNELKHKQMEKHYKQLLQDKARTQLIIDDIMPVVASIPARHYPEILRTKSKYSDEELVLLLSDLQLGSKVDKNETGGLGEYNIEIFKHRLNTLINEVIEFTEKQKSSINIPKLHIAFLGDIVDGETIYRGQAHEIDMDVANQVFTGCDLLSSAVDRLSDYFPSLYMAIMVELAKKAKQKIM